MLRSFCFWFAALARPIADGGLPAWSWSGFYAQAECWQRCHERKQAGGAVEVRRQAGVFPPLAAPERSHGHARMRAIVFDSDLALLFECTCPAPL